MKALAGRGIVVTGAGGGIGRGIALACAAAGAHVVVAARGENGQAVADEITARGDSAEWVRCDVADAATVAAAIDAAVATAGGLDAFVHNATSGASSQPHRLEDVSAELFADHAGVSLRGAFIGAQAALPALHDRGGTFIVMSSPAGMEGSAMLPMYATMKGALRGFGKSLSREWGPLGVRVNIVSPLGMSPAMEKAIKADPDMKKRFSARIPLGRVGDAETDVGVAVAFLCGPDARYISGQTLGIDGGQFTSF